MLILSVGSDTQEATQSELDTPEVKKDNSNNKLKKKDTVIRSQPGW